MMQYFVPPGGSQASIAPSLQPPSQRVKRGIGTDGILANGVNGESKVNGAVSLHSEAPYPYDTCAEPGNPTVIPTEMLKKFHFTFLIRDPHASVPSYYRCTLPPLREMTGWTYYDPQEAGYTELRRTFDYLKEFGHVGPHHANDFDKVSSGDHTTGDEICVVDADDLLDDPEGILRTYCRSTGIPFEADMMNWDNEEDQAIARKVFAKWKGFHEDALDSKYLHPRVCVSRALPVAGFDTAYLIMAEEGGEDRGGVGCGVDKDIRRGSGENDPGDCRSEHGRLPLHEEVRRQAGIGQLEPTGLPKGPPFCLDVRESVDLVAPTPSLSSFGCLDYFRKARPTYTHSRNDLSDSWILIYFVGTPSFTEYMIVT